MTRRPLAVPDWALLVGIDRYAPSCAGYRSYPPLAGAVRDVEGMEALLRALGVASRRIKRLTAPLDGPLPPPGRLPTYENLVTGLKRLSAVARCGEQVLVFFAGHGARAVTAFPEIKGEGGCDEALAPWNISDPGVRYLRDIELAHLVHRMVERGVFLTLILDCCHAGSALRQANDSAAVRGLVGIDARPAPAASLAGSRAELLASWRRHVDTTVAATSGWLPSPRGYVLLAACEEHEKAFEYAFDGEHREGVFSHALLDALAPRSRISYRQLYARVFAEVRSAFASQTPQLEGDEDRFVFEPLRQTRLRGVAVLRVDPAGRQVLLHAGEAQGVRPGTRFMVTAGEPPAGEEAPAGLSVEVSRSGSTLSWAQAAGDLPADLSPGAQAHLIALPTLLRVALCGPKAMTATVAGVLSSEAGGFAVAVRPAARFDLQLAVDASGRLELRDERGERLPNQGLPLSIGSASFAAGLAEQLLHLARYRVLLALPGPPQGALLSGKLRVRMLGRPGDSDQSLQPGSELSLSAAEGLPLELCNLASQHLYLVILTLRADWSIAQLYPPLGLGRASLPLAPGLPLRLTLKWSRAPGVEPGYEEILALATTGASELRWLELPPLDPRLRTRSTPATMPSSPMRALEPEAVADRGWTMWRLRLRDDARTEP